MIAKKGHEMLVRFVYACVVCMYGVRTLMCRGAHPRVPMYRPKEDIGWVFHTISTLLP